MKIIRNKIDELQYKIGHCGEIEIEDIKVMSERKKGIGREMFNELLELNPKTVYAFTRKSNVVGRHFYKALGFREIELPNFYSEEDAILVIYENSLYRKI